MNPFPRNLAALTFVLALGLCWPSLHTVSANPSPAASHPIAEIDLSKFKIEGDPASENGATWTYEATDNGLDYELNATS